MTLEPLPQVSERAGHIPPGVGDVGGRLIISKPKTEGSAAGVGLSERVVAALRRQWDRVECEKMEWAEAYEDNDLVFCRENGAPLRPEHVARRFRAIIDRSGLRRVRVHDLRHLAATMVLTNGVPLPGVSKTLRHSQVGITANLYGHLTKEASTAAADALGGALDAAAAEAVNERAAKGA